MSWQLRWRQQRVLVNAWEREARWLWLLRPLELLFRLLAAARRAGYRYGLLSSYRAPVPVVVVGNISVGGTGKTPVVIALVEGLQARGIRAGVVSRGYGAATVVTAPLRVGADTTAQQCGDEPLLVYRRTGCCCVVAADRAEAARDLLEHTPVDVIISDDGLQHYGLARDLEIALVDARRGHGNGFCLPAGPLREPESRLQAADFVLYRGGEDPATAMNYGFDSLVRLQDGESGDISPDALGRQIHAVAGIARPQQFFDTLVELGFDVEPHPFADHHAYSAADFKGLADLPVIMTEKDAVKCASLAGDNAWALRINAQLPAAVIAAVASLAGH
jgi:tetraacyldisaccharide 4'-kinase